MAEYPSAPLASPSSRGSHSRSRTRLHGHVTQWVVTPGESVDLSFSCPSPSHDGHQRRGKRNGKNNSGCGFASYRVICRSRHATPVANGVKVKTTGHSHRYSVPLNDLESVEVEIPIAGGADPYSPLSCMYTIHGDDRSAAPADSFRQALLKSSSGFSLSSLAFSEEDGNSDVVLAPESSALKWISTPFSMTAGMEEEDSQLRCAGTSGTLGACLSSSGDGTPVPLRSSVNPCDGYDAFLYQVAAIQNYCDLLQQLMNHLRSIYEKEQFARLQACRHRQQLTWARTVEATATANFWLEKVKTIREFERVFFAATAALQNELRIASPLISGSGKADASSSGGVTTAAAPLPSTKTARQCFLNSTELLLAQERHVNQVVSRLRHLWDQEWMLREEIRQFEHLDPRNPQKTFAAAGMDAEHSLVSLPSRMTATTIPSPTHDVYHAMGNDSEEEEPLTPELLTAKNLSPNSLNSYSNQGDCEDYGSGSGEGEPVSHADERLDKTTGEAGDSFLPGDALLPSRLKLIIRSVALAASQEEGMDVESHGNSINPNPNGSNQTRSGSSSNALHNEGGLSNPPVKRHRKRVTFALEAEVISAHTRGKVSVHCRTAELLEGIFLDKQTPWSCLNLLEKVLAMHQERFAALRERAEMEGERTMKCTEGRPTETHGRRSSRGIESSSRQSRRAGGSRNSAGDAAQKTKSSQCTRCSVM